MKGKRGAVLIGALAFAFLIGCLSWAGEPEYLKKFERRGDLERAIAELKAAIKRLEREIRELKRGPRPEGEIEPPRERPERPPMPPLPERGELRFYKLEHARAREAFEIINKFLSPVGAAWFDARTNSLIVRDLPEYLDDVERIIRFIDVPVRRRPEMERREVVRRRARERRIEREGKIEVRRGVVVLEPGGEGEVTLFRETDMPISISFRPTVEDERVELRLVISSPKWEGKIKVTSVTELGVPKVVEREGLRIRYEVNRTEEGKLRIDYEVKRGRRG